MHIIRVCLHLSNLLKREGRGYVSPPTVQSILDKHGMGRRYERLLKLEAKHPQEGRPLNAEQVRAIERANPRFRERHVESSRPGAMLSADTLFVGHFKCIGKVNLHAVVEWRHSALRPYRFRLPAHVEATISSHSGVV